MRTGFGSNNVDHCTRLCHASSVAALLEGVGSGAVSNQVNDVEHAELIFVIGSNPTANHPVAATWMKNAAKRGAKIVLADPRVTDIGRHAWRTLQFKADTDVAHAQRADPHGDRRGPGRRRPSCASAPATSRRCARTCKGYSPEAMAPICGIPAETLREVARAFATAKGAMILWGMGISQHVHGTDNARCLIALVHRHRPDRQARHRPASAARPEQRAGRERRGPDPDDVPQLPARGQRRARTPGSRSSGARRSTTTPGYTVVEIMHKALAPDSDPHKIRGMYIMGENPAMSDPDLNHARACARRRWSTWWCRTSS